jgi:hypothetical protein
LYLPKCELARELPSQNPTGDADDDDLEEGWKITSEMKQAMQQAEWLRNELKDGGLQQIIAGIQAAPNVAMKRNQTLTKQEIELHRTKQDNPQFQKFLDKLLVLTGVLEREDPEQSLEEWLNADVTTLLCLRPIGGTEARKDRTMVQSSVEQEGDEDDNDDNSHDPSGSESPMDGIAE